MAMKWNRIDKMKLTVLPLDNCSSWFFILLTLQQIAAVCEISSADSLPSFFPRSLFSFICLHLTDGGLFS